MADYLRPQDLVVALQLVHYPGALYEDLASTLQLSVSAVHRAVKRLEAAGLVVPEKRKTNLSAFLEFVEHGVRYAFPAKRGPEVRGVPTAWSVPDLIPNIPPQAGRHVVWADPTGKQRGESISPLYDAAPSAAKRNQQLHRSLALIDAIRIGQVRERRIAFESLKAELQP